MSIEKRIQMIIDEYDIPHLCYLEPIEQWGIEHFEPHGAESNPVIEGIIKVNKLIEEATVAECLSSPALYIREYKRRLTNG